MSEEQPPLPAGKTLTRHTPAEQRIVELSAEMLNIRAHYETLINEPGNAARVNKDARQLAERLLAVDDSNLSLGMAIFKYQDVAYSWAMVLGSESDSQAKLRSINDILYAIDRAQSIVGKANQPGPFDREVQDTREWLINDDALPRLQRLSAVALCARWQLEKNEEDRLRVRQILGSFPYDYLFDERPEQSVELQPCLTDLKSRKPQ